MTSSFSRQTSYQGDVTTDPMESKPERERERRSAVVDEMRRGLVAAPGGDDEDGNHGGEVVPEGAVPDAKPGPAIGRCAGRHIRDEVGNAAAQ